MTPFEKQYLDKFQQLDLKPKDFDHHGHLYMAWLHLKYFEFSEANQRVCNGIRDLAVTLNVPDKYNRTLTQALMVIMADRLTVQSKNSFDIYLENNPDLVENAWDVLLGYYSEARLTSEQARTNWTEPDLQELP